MMTTLFQKRDARQSKVSVFSPLKVGTIVGSVRRESINRRLAQALIRLAPSTLAFEDIQIDGLPMYNADLEGARPDPVNHFTTSVADCDAVFIVTPEYNRSLPALLKNAIDWGSKPVEKNVWRDKPAAIIGASPGAIGSAAGQLHLRQILSVLSASVMGGEAYISFKPGLICEDGHIGDEATRRFVQAYVERFAIFASKLSAA